MSVIEPASSGLSADQDVLCPLCGYNLRGLPEPRCPECGAKFTWEELRDRLQSHPYLFEHHPGRNVYSFVRTLLGSLLPRRFFRTLLPTMAINRRRLYRFAVLIVLLALSGSLIGFSEYAMRVARDNAQARVWRSISDASAINPQLRVYDPYLAAAVQQYGSLQNYERAKYPELWDLAFWPMILRDVWQYPRFQVSVATPAMIALLWAPLTFAALTIFRASLRQAKIKYEHVVRCVVYSGAVLALLGPYLLLVTTCVTPWQPYGLWTYFGRIDVVPVACGVVILILAYRLASAYRLYLRFPHAFLTVLASQVIVFLALLKLHLVMSGM